MYSQLIREQVKPLALFGRLFIRWRLLLASCVLLLAFSGHLDNTLDKMGRGYIVSQSQDFLVDAEKRAADTFMLLSVSKSTLSVLESGTAGVSFFVDVQVKLGQLLAPLKELLDTAWSFTLHSLSLLVVEQILLDVVNDLFEPFLLLVACVWLCFEVAKIYRLKWVNRLDNSVRRLTLLLLLLFIALPMSLAITSTISSNVTQDLSVKVNQGFVQHNQKFTIEQQSGSLKDSAEGAIKLFEQNRSQQHQHVSDMKKYVYTHIAIGLLEVVFLPLMFLLFIQFGFKMLLTQSSASLNSHIKK